MKYPHMIQSIVLSTLLLGCSIQAEINNHQESSLSASQEENSEFAEFAEDMVVRAFTALQKIENKLTEIALLVKKGLFKGAHPAKVMDVLTEDKMTINALLQNQAAVIALKDPEQHLEIAFVVSEFCNAFIPYLDKHIKNNFKNAKPFDLTRFLKNLHKGKKRNNFDHLQPEALKKGLRITTAKLRNLNTTVKNIGLTWYNKAARELDKWVVTPANKWHVPTVVTYGTGLGLLSAYSLWSYGYLIQDSESTPTLLKDSITKLYEMFGKPIVRNRAGNPKLLKQDKNESSRLGGYHYDKKAFEKEEAKPLYSHKNSSQDTLLEDEKLPTDASLFATFDYALKDFLLQSQPLGALAAGYMLNSMYKTWKEDVYPKVIKKRDEWWNFLRGGEYLNTFQPGLLAIKPTVSFKDMVGLDEVKESFYTIIQYIDNPEQLMRIGVTPEKGWLLTGPTRTGKSFSVECLCGEIELLMAKRGQANKMKFFNINASLVNEYGIKAILDEVRENAPAVIFIDEIDLLGLQRVGNNKLLSDFLTAMQTSMNADPSKVVIIIAATNNPENMDGALRQPGRFGKEIRFEYPAKKYRMQYIARELKNMALNIKEFDIETLADKTSEKSFEALKKVIGNAMTRSWLHSVSLTQELLEESIDTEIHHIISCDRKDLPEAEKRIVATHFAGIALAAMHLESHEQLDKVTIKAHMTDLKEVGVWENYSKEKDKTDQKKIEYGKLITKQSHDTINAKSEAVILNEVTLLLAGFAAEELLLGRCGFTCHRNDRDKAYKSVEDLVFGGLDHKALPKIVREELKTKAYDLLKECHKNAMELLANHRDALAAITEELMRKQILNDKEIKVIIDKSENKASSSTTTQTDDTVEETVADTATEESAQEVEQTEDTTNEIILDDSEEIQSEEE